MNVEGVERELDLGTMLISEARELKKFTGWTQDAWREQLGLSDPDAIAFAWWLANRRAGAPLAGAFTDVDFDLTALEVTAVVDVDAATGDEGDDENAEGPIGSEPESESPSSN